MILVHTQTMIVKQETRKMFEIGWVKCQKRYIFGKHLEKCGQGRPRKSL